MKENRQSIFKSTLNFSHLSSGIEYGLAICSSFRLSQQDFKILSQINGKEMEHRQGTTSSGRRLHTKPYLTRLY